MPKRGLSVLWIGTVVCLSGALSASADLQNVRVSGELRIRGYWWNDSFNQGLVAPGMVLPEVRWPARCFLGRPIGDFLGGQTVMSYWDWDDRDADYRMVLQRTVLNVDAALSDNVAACVSLDSVDTWGEDFRSNVWTGADARAASVDDAEVYQAFIEADELAGLPLRLRVVRQELVLGDGWLVGNSTHRTEFGWLSFDGLRATYAADAWSLDAFWAKLNERSPIEQDGDVDLSGLYAAYTGIDDVSLDAYWFWVRDAQSLMDTNGGWLRNTIEEAVGLDNYKVTNLHTVGARLAGTRGGLDFALDGAYQFGDAGQIGFLFKPGVYGDSDATFSSWAGNAEVGYTLDMGWQPRVFMGAAYFSGEDNRDISFWQWLNPFDLPRASVSFNRLFSDVSYSVFLDEMGELSNFWAARAGVSVKPVEKVEAGLGAAYLAALKTFDRPAAIRVGHRWWLVVAPTLSFWTQESSADMGVETSLWARYHYSQDLTVEAGWSHLFTGPGLLDGNYSDYNGLQFNGGTGQDDADYLYVELKVTF